MNPYFLWLHPWVIFLNIFRRDSYRKREEMLKEIQAQKEAQAREEARKKAEVIRGRIFSCVRLFYE
jgi:hypothetical protein